MHNPDTVEKEKRLAARLTDLSYQLCAEIFSDLEHYGYVQGIDDVKRLSCFLETVAFVVFWIRKSCLKRVFKDMRKRWERVFFIMIDEWSSFFSDYPEGPTLENLQDYKIAPLISRKCAHYDRLYEQERNARGTLYAQNICLLEMLQHISRQAGVEDGEISEQGREEIVRQLGRTLQGLTRRLNKTMLDAPL